MEKVLSFQNKKDQNLFGIVHEPEVGPQYEERIGIIILNAGVKSRVAPNRLSVKIARRLCAEGYYVYHFDASGLGDSEGEMPEGVLIADIWEEIQSGLLIRDTLEASAFFRKTYNIDKLYLIGNCGGAITSLLTAEHDDRIEGLCLIDVPINLRKAQTTFADKASSEGKKTDWYFIEYIKKIYKVEAWKRFFTFKTNYRALWTVLINKLKRIVNKSGVQQTAIQFTDEFCNKNNLNKKFFTAFDHFIKLGKKILFIQAGNDSGTEIFDKYFNLYIKNQNSRMDSLIETYLIENANHIYTLIDWQEDLMSKLKCWFLQHTKE